MRNQLIIADTHAPFTHKKYLGFVARLRDKYKCNKIKHIGDAIDGNAWNYHEKYPNGKSPDDELSYAIECLQPWYREFPNVQILLGNHDKLLTRKATTIGLPSKAIVEYRDFIEAPKGWNFFEEIIEDNVLYTHGTVGDAVTRARDSGISCVQGHFHTKAFIQYLVSYRAAKFAMQVGTGIDRHAYPFGYSAGNAKKPVISAGLVLDNGRLPIIELMPL